EAYWDEPKDAFDAEVERVTALREEVKGQLSTLSADTAALQRSVITSGKCPTCGHAAMTDEHVREMNAKTQAAIDEKKVASASLFPVLKEHNATLDELAAIEKAARGRAAAISRVSAWVDVDESVYPPRAAWRGEPPQQVDAAQARADLEALEAADRTAAQAEGRA